MDQTDFDRWMTLPFDELVSLSADALAAGIPNAADEPSGDRMARLKNFLDQHRGPLCQWLRTDSTFKRFFDGGLLYEAARAVGSYVGAQLRGPEGTFAGTVAVMVVRHGVNWVCDRQFATLS